MMCHDSSSEICNDLFISLLIMQSCVCAVEALTGRCVRPPLTVILLPAASK